MPRVSSAERRSLPIAEWPEWDRNALASALTKGELFDEQGLGAHWEPRTVETTAERYGRWLGWHAWRGELRNEAPAGRVTPERVRAYREHLAASLAPVTVLGLLVALKVTMQVMAPDRSWRWLQDLCNRVQRRARPSKDKQSKMRHPAEIADVALACLAELPAQITTPDDAIRFRNALMLLIAAHVPLRARNIAMIAIGRHLIDRGDEWWLTFTAAETKTHKALTYPVPERAVPWLLRWLTGVRPFLLGSKRNNSFWLNRFGDAMPYSAVWWAITGLTRERLGVAINPHLLRDCVATMLAEEADGSVNFVPGILGHRNRQTGDRYYIHSDGIAAGRRIDALITQIEADLMKENLP